MVHDFSFIRLLAVVICFSGFLNNALHRDAAAITATTIKRWRHDPRFLER
ncbi:MAG: hypothetical protein ABW069_14900 [Duganella sp.]